MELQKIIWITYGNTLLYATCFWIQYNTIPFLLKEMSGSAVTYGYLETTFALLQLIGGPMYGRFGDLYGARLALILSTMSTALSYFILSQASTIVMLFVARLPSIFIHTMQGGQMVITDVSTPDSRVDTLGKLGVAYGAGMVVGNLLGGVLTKHTGVRSTALVAALGAILSTLIVYIFIPCSLKRPTAIISDPTTKSTFPCFDAKKFRELIVLWKVKVLLAVKVATGIPMGVVQSMFPIVAVNILKVGPQTNGFIMAYVGVVSMIVQGLGLAIFTKKFTDNQLLKASIFFLIIGYVFLSWVANVTQFCAVLLPLVVGLSVKNIVISSALTKSVPSDDTGSVLGINMSINNVIRIIAPTLGAYMLSNLGFASFGWLGTISSIIIAVFIFRVFRD